MNKRHFVLGTLLSTSLIAGPASSPSATAAKPPVETPQPITDNTEPTARVVAYGARDVVIVKTHLRYTTLIVLPKNEQILDITCGDKEYWAINGNLNFAYVKPAKAGAQTNLNLVTASGNIYSFVLSEISEAPRAVPDLKVFVELKDEGMRASAGAAPKFVPAEEVDAYKRQVEKAQDEVRQSKQAQQDAINQGINRFVSNVRFAYQFEAGKKPFYVRSMYHDEHFTYIQARPEETPTLYEVRDGKPNLVNFTYKDGVYVVDKILDKGYLVVGKQKLGFTREE